MFEWYQDFFGSRQASKLAASDHVESPTVARFARTALLSVVLGMAPTLVALDMTPTVDTSTPSDCGFLSRTFEVTPEGAAVLDGIGAEPTADLVDLFRRI